MLKMGSALGNELKTGLQEGGSQISWLTMIGVLWSTNYFFLTARLILRNLGQQETGQRKRRYKQTTIKATQTSQNRWTTKEKTKGKTIFLNRSHGDNMLNTSSLGGQ